MHHPTDRIAHTTAFVTPVVESLIDDIFFKITELKLVINRKEITAIWITESHDLSAIPTEKISSPKKNIYLQCNCWF